MQIEAPYLLFLGDVKNIHVAKTACGVFDWRRELCLAQYRLPGCEVALDLPEMTPAEAAAAGARTMILGAAFAGGGLPENWIAPIVAALDAGMDVANGLHARLSENPVVAAAAARNGRALHDVRHTDRRFPVGKGVKRSGLRLLTVGTDCACGKKYTALTIHRSLVGRGYSADFRATGQTGILIAGSGLGMDTIPADFSAGAAEWLTPDAPDDHWDIIEGQGCVFHPSYSGASLSLLHGSQPDAFVVCHEPTRRTMRGVDYPTPSVREVMDAVLTWGRLTNPAIQCVGVSIDTHGLPENHARQMLLRTNAEFGLPAVDPMRFGVEPLVDHLTATVVPRRARPDAASAGRELQL